MLSILLVFLAAQFSTIYSKSTDTPGNFDYYVFAYSWQPEFCYDQSGYPGCSNPQSFWGKYFTIHGLWPQYSAGGYPESCTNEPFDPNVPDQIGMDTMTTYWPNVKENVDDADYDSFWEHEWTKHGTCTGLKQLEYFNTTIILAQMYGTPSQFTEAVGGEINAADLRKYMGGADKVSLLCNDKKYVVGALSCWDKVDDHPQVLVPCASDVKAEDTCTEDVLVVQSF